MKRALLIAGIAVCLAGSAGCATEYYPPREGEKQGAIKRTGCLPWSNGTGKNMPLSNSNFGFNVGK